MMSIIVHQLHCEKSTDITPSSGLSMGSSLLNMLVEKRIAAIDSAKFGHIACCVIALYCVIVCCGTASGGKSASPSALCIAIAAIDALQKEVTGC
jgi:hypothetical protein